MMWYLVVHFFDGLTTLELVVNIFVLLSIVLWSIGWTLMLIGRP